MRTPWLCLLTVGCAPAGLKPESLGDPGLDGADGDADADADADAVDGEDGFGDGGDGSEVGPEEGPDTCDENSILILLDRTGTMAQTVGGAVPGDLGDSKWARAVAGITSLVHAQVPSEEGNRPIDSMFRLGLALFPQAAEGCHTVPEYIQDPLIFFSNPHCLGPELLVPPEYGTADAISGSIDTGTTPVCESTPISQALRAASGFLPPEEEGQGRYLILVTDGFEHNAACNFEAEVDGLPQQVREVQALARAGITTLVVSLEPAFNGQWIAEGLNNMACAGMAVDDLEAQCEGDEVSGYRARAGIGEKLYSEAEDADTLARQIGRLVQEICCDCSGDELVW